MNNAVKVSTITTTIMGTLKSWSEVGWSLDFSNPLVSSHVIGGVIGAALFGMVVSYIIIKIQGKRDSVPSTGASTYTELPQPSPNEHQAHPAAVGVLIAVIGILAVIFLGR